jgi:hypothetical protein
MSRLHDYNLVDVVAGSYQAHPCLQLKTAIRCVAGSVEEKFNPQYWSTSRRLLDYIEELESPRFDHLWRSHFLDKNFFDAADLIAGVAIRLESAREGTADVFCAHWQVRRKRSD